MNTQFKKGIVELCVLSEIERQDMYGYELVQSISEFIEVSESTIYPILRRLTKEGNFTTYMKESTGGPNRKYYKITNQGKGRYLDMKEDWDKFLENVKSILDRGENHE